MSRAVVVLLVLIVVLSAAAACAGNRPALPLAPYRIITVSVMPKRMTLGSGQIGKIQARAINDWGADLATYWWWTSRTPRVVYVSNNGGPAATVSAASAGASWVVAFAGPERQSDSALVTVAPIHPRSEGTLRRIGDGHYESMDGRFGIIWSAETDTWIVFEDGNTEPACEAAWGKGYR